MAKNLVEILATRKSEIKYKMKNSYGILAVWNLKIKRKSG